MKTTDSFSKLIFQSMRDPPARVFRISLLPKICSKLYVFMVSFSEGMSNCRCSTPRTKKQFIDKQPLSYMHNAKAPSSGDRR